MLKIKVQEMQFQIKGINLAMHTELFRVKFKSNVKLRG